MQCGLRHCITCRYQSLKKLTDCAIGEPIVQSCGLLSHHQPLPTITFGFAPVKAELRLGWGGVDVANDPAESACPSARRRALKASIGREHWCRNTGFRNALECASQG